MCVFVFVCALVGLFVFGCVFAASQRFSPYLPKWQQICQCVGSRYKLQLAPKEIVIHFELSLTI